jgi:hypothetical protein
MKVKNYKQFNEAQKMSSLHQNGYWTKDKLQEEVNKYSTRTEFNKNNAYAYTKALKMNILDELFKNHQNNGYSNKQEVSGYWTETRLQEEVNKYKTRNEFNKNNKSAYSKALKLNILDELFKNHINHGYINKEEWKENSYVIYVYELVEFNSAYVGLTNNMKRRDKEHLFDEKEKMSLFCKENNISYPKYKILEENLASTEAQRQEKYWVDFYKDNGWKIFNIIKTGGLGGVGKKWTKKELQEEVDKYKTRVEFRKNSKAYSAATKRNIINDLFKNNPNNGYSDKQKIKGYWTKERLQEEADKYKNRAGFYKNNPSAYYKALKLNILNDLFKNHLNNGYSENRNIYGYWTDARLQEEANKYKNIKEFRKNNYNAYQTSKKRKLLNILFKNENTEI